MTCITFFGVFTAGIVAMACSTAAMAQAAEDGGSCELHVWPAAGIIAVRQHASESWNGAGILQSMIKKHNAAVAERAEQRAEQTLGDALATEPLSPERQKTLIASLSLPARLGIATHRLVVHAAPLDSRTIRSVKTRYDAAVSAPCYADLVVDEVVYSREYARGRNLKTFARFRDFGSSASILRSFATFVQTKLLIFSLDPPVVTEAATAELRDAFSKNLENFAALAVKKSAYRP